MIKQLLAATALTSLVATAALAETMKTDTAAPGAPVMQPTTMFDRNAEAMPDMGGYFEATPGQILASSVMGQSVWVSANADATVQADGEAERIGEVNDLVLGANGDADAVILGVGGFLGIGEKDVAIDFDRLSWVERDGERWLTVDATREELEGAPAYDRNLLMEEHQAAVMPEEGAEAETETAANDTTQLNNVTPESGDNAMAQNEAGIDQATPGSTIDMETTASASPEFTIVDRGTLTAEELIGIRVYGADDADLGEIGDILLTTDNAVEAYIIDVGGFLGLGEKPVAVDASELEIMQSPNGYMMIKTPFTQEQLEAKAEYSADAWETDRDAVILR